MDPLSITTSVIALVQALGVGVKFFSSMRQIPADFCDLSNELTDLQAVAEQVKTSLQEMENGDTKNAAVPGITASAIQTLEDDFALIVHELEALCGRLQKSDRHADIVGELRVSKRKWLREKDNVARLRAKASKTKQSLMLRFIALVSSQSTRQTKVVLDGQQAFSACFETMNDRIEAGNAGLRETQSKNNDICASLHRMLAAEATGAEPSLPSTPHGQRSNAGVDEPLSSISVHASLRQISLRNVNLEVAKFLLDHGWSRSTRNMTGWTVPKRARIILYSASKQGHLSTFDPDHRYMIEQLARGEDRQVENSTLLHDSVLGVVPIPLSDAITQAPSDIDCLDDIGWSPLHWAIFLNDYESFEVLRSRGAGLEVRTRGGWTPLHYAAHYEPPGSIKMASALLKAGANVHARVQNHIRPRGETPIIFAFNNPDMIKILLEHGCDTIVQTNLNWETPLSWFARGACNVERNDLRRRNWERSLDLLVNNGMDIDLPSKQAGYEGRTPIHDAILWRNAALLELLLTRGARYDAIDKNGSGILHLSAQSANLDVIEILRDACIRGLSPNQPNVAGDPPMKILMARMLGEEATRQPGDTVPAYDEFLLFKQLLQEIQERNLGLYRTRDHIDSVEDDAVSEIGGPKAACDGDDNRTFESNLAYMDTVLSTGAIEEFS
ncbi:ankyrin repeat protein [Colletotrichum asianum]|uniref:Ankyrin repeat protein n=1 Tax=Colletotrichum asianum TaxID=702518 RepID=A0A8H3WJH5_9PEZI|nr:ankyrin repeat protein [Colletotrichum asianum]